MESALRPGKALANDSGVLTKQNTHLAPLTAATTFSAASVRLLAAIIFKPLSPRTLRPNSALLPSSRTTTGTVTINGGTQSWTIVASGTNLTFSYNGVAKFRLQSDGAFIAAGDITAFGTP